MRSCLLLPQPVARPRVEVEAVDLLQLRDALEGRALEGRLALEGVQHDALEQVAQRHVVVFGEALEDLEEPLLDLHAGLDALDLEARLAAFRGGWPGHGAEYICTYVLEQAEKMGQTAPIVSHVSGRGER